jgi:hypothetical protein
MIGEENNFLSILCNFSNTLNIMQD